MANKVSPIIETIPFRDRLRIQVLSFVLGFWVLCKRFLNWLWDPNDFYALRVRDNPPACLVESTLGQHKYVKLKGIKFHYVESGTKNQPLLLLLHGFPDFWLGWRHQLPSFSEHFRVVAVDLKGFGDSDKPIWRRSYRVDTILDELKQFIHSLGVSSCIVVGHDLGALLGWYLVHRSPDMVDKFVAVSTPHPNMYWKTLPGKSNFNSNWFNFIQLPYLPELDALKEDLSIISKCYRHLQGNESYLEAYKYSFSRKEDWTGPINYYRNLPFSRICEDTEQTNVSTLLVTGNRDSYTSLEGVVKSTEYSEKAFVKIMDGVGHFPHQEDPEQFNRVVLKFLKVKPMVERQTERQPSGKGLMDRMFGAVSNTVKYGNSVLDSVQKRTSDVVGRVPAIGLGLSHNSRYGD